MYWAASLSHVEIHYFLKRFEVMTKISEEVKGKRMGVREGGDQQRDEVNT